MAELVPATPTYSILFSPKERIEYVARQNLERYSVAKLKEHKLATSTLKYGLTFSTSNYDFPRELKAFFTYFLRNLYRERPFLKSRVEGPFATLTGNAYSSASVTLFCTPFPSSVRYINRLQRWVDSARLPLRIEHNIGSLEKTSITIYNNSISPEDRYYMYRSFLYLPVFIQVCKTLGRKAYFDDVLLRTAT